MRVISGTARGRKLKEPAGYDIRPTSDNVKESIFNIIQFDIEGRRVLDLFSGTGQIGIEALSRGADSVVFVDRSAEASKLVWENLERCGFMEFAKVYTRDVSKFIANEEKFDLIILDPPYDSQLALLTLNRIIEFDKLNVNGIIICETGVDWLSPEMPSPYYFAKEFIYGSVKITKFGRR